MRVFYNEDNSHFWCTRHAAGISVNEEVLRNFIEQFRDSDITDFVLNVNGRLSSKPSQTLEWIGNRSIATEENGIPVDYSNTWGALQYDVMHVQKLDAYGIWISALWQIGIHPWVSFRMNDCHEMGLETALLKGEYMEQHPELWISKGRPVREGYDKNYNYLLPEVRSRMLNYIREQLEQYDLYGIELDFSREPFCFPAGQEEKGRAVMTSFFGDVKNLVDEFSALRSRKIQINLLLPASPITVWQVGFDVQEIVRLGYIDSLGVSNRWLTINCDLPIELWKQLIMNQIPVAGVQQLLVSGYHFSKHIQSDCEMVYGQTAAYLSRGADFIYLYNFFDSIEEGLDSSTHSRACRNFHDEIIRTIGHINELASQNRRCPLTYYDFAAPWEPLQERLPIIMKNHLDAALCRNTGAYCIGNYDFASARICTGDFNKQQQAFIILETQEPIDPTGLAIYVNRELAQYVSIHKEDPGIVKQNAYTFAFRADVEKTAIVEILSNILCRIEYMEIYIEGLF